MAWLRLLLLVPPFADAAQAGTREAQQRWQEIAQRNAAVQNKEFSRLRQELPLVASRECSPERGNSTFSLVRCAVAKSVDQKVEYTMARQEALTWKAMDYIYQLQAEADAYLKTVVPLPKSSGTALFPAFSEDLALMHKAAGAYPRVYVLDTWGDDPECEDPNLGYTYFLEHWMQSFMKHPNQAIVKSVMVADYVYLPFCIRQKLFLTTQRNEARQGRLQYLLYEGKLQRSAVRAVDEGYLLEGVRRAAKKPEFAHCMERESCRFLTTSIDGRHVYRNFSSFFGSKLVFMTYMGMSDWAPKQKGDLYWTDLHRVSMQSQVPLLRQPGLPRGCRAACPLHCRLEPPAILQDDIVLPWTVMYKWTARSADFHSRDLLAFFSGSLSSCSRELLINVFDGEFISAVRGRGPLASGADLSRSVLVFPQHIRIEQPEWSELAFRSKVCLVPDGDCAASVRLLEVLMHGCVPMIITNRLLPPVHQYVDWRKIAFWVREDEIPALPGILAWIAREQQTLREKQHRLAEAAKYLDYNREFPAMLLVALRKQAEARRRPTEDGWGS